jgi:hypothetical protein
MLEALSGKTIAHNGLVLADVPAFVIRQLKFITKVE